MKMNKKGFTLIELLAVIVILAVIALIAVPQVLSILNKSNVKAAENTGYGLVSAAETFVANYLMDNNYTMFYRAEFEFTTTDGETTMTGTVYSSDDDTDGTPVGSTTLDFKGTKPSAGTIAIDNDSKVTFTGITINGFNCTKTNDIITCGE